MSLQEEIDVIVEAAVKQALATYDQRCQQRMDQFVLHVQEALGQAVSGLHRRIDGVNAALGMIVTSEKERAQILGQLVQRNPNTPA